LPIDDDDFAALLAEMHLNRSDFSAHWQMIRDIRDQLAREREATPESAADSERFPTGLNSLKTRIV
jgi:hypothetical protein